MKKYTTEFTQELSFIYFGPVTVLNNIRKVLSQMIISCKIERLLLTFNIITFSIILGHYAHDFNKDNDSCVINLSSLQMLYSQIQVHQQQTKLSCFFFFWKEFKKDF